MNTMMASRGGMGIALAVLLGAAIGCGEVTTEDAPDAGGTGGGAGSVDPGTGGTGVGGAQVHLGTGGAGAGTGGAPAPSYFACSVYNWIPAGSGQCSKEISVGRWIYGTKDGRQCHECDTPIRPAGVPECLFADTNEICVLSCDECAFQ